MGLLAMGLLAMPFLCQITDHPQTKPQFLSLTDLLSRPWVSRALLAVAEKVGTAGVASAAAVAAAAGGSWWHALLPLCSATACTDPNMPRHI
jgi:hypothetical protein